MSCVPNLSHDPAAVSADGSASIPVTLLPPVLMTSSHPQLTSPELAAAPSAASRPPAQKASRPSSAHRPPSQSFVHGLQAQLAGLRSLATTQQQPHNGRSRLGSGSGPASPEAYRQQHMSATLPLPRRFSRPGARQPSAAAAVDTPQQQGLHLALQQGLPQLGAAECLWPPGVPTFAGHFGQSRPASQPAAALLRDSHPVGAVPGLQQTAFEMHAAQDSLPNAQVSAARGDGWPCTDAAAQGAVNAGCHCQRVLEAY